MSAEKHTPRPVQEEAIELALSQIGASNGVLLGDDMGVGKTTIGVEFVLRAATLHGWTRVLFIALGDTHKQWDERMRAQSDGRHGIRIMNGTTVEGRANWEAFMKHEPGFYIATTEFLRDKDWETHVQRDGYGRPVFERDKATGEIKFKPRRKGPFQGELLESGKVEHRKTAAGVIGPALTPKVKTKSVRKHAFRRLERKPLDAVIYDEVQAIANRKSNTRQTILSIKAEFRMALSGTWFLNSVENQWSVARWVWPGINPETDRYYIETSFERWKKRFLQVENIYSASGRVVTDARNNALTRVVGEKIPGEFTSTLPAYRRVEAERPPTPERVYVDPTPEQLRQMAELNRDLLTWVQDWQGNDMPLVADLPPVLRMRLRQVAIAELSMKVDPDTGEESVFIADDAASAKLRPLRALIEGPYAGQPVGIYTDSKIGAEFITKRMQLAGFSARAWTGDLSRKEREEMKQAYMAGEFDYIVATVQSFGTGIDGFQKRANKVIWISKADGNPALNDQAIARFFRPGRTLEWGGFQQVEIIMRGSVDEISLENLIRKAWAMRAAMNGGIAA